MGNEAKQNGVIRIVIIMILVFAVLWFIQVRIKRTYSGRVATSQDMEDYRKGRLNEFAQKVEFFKKKNGRYPDDLSGISIMSSDRSGGRILYNVSSDGQFFELRDAGSDGKVGTVDDMVWHDKLGEGKILVSR